MKDEYQESATENGSSHSPVSAEGSDRRAATATRVGLHLRQLGGESVVYGLAGMATTIVGVMLVPFYTRVFSPADYGTLSLVGATMAIVAIMVVLGLDGAAHRWYWDTTDLDERKKSVASWVWCQSSLSVFSAIVIFVHAEWLSALVNAGATGASLFRIAAVAMPIQGLAGIGANWFRMQRRPWGAMMLGLAQSVVAVACTVMFVLVLKWGLPGVLAGQLAGGAIGAAWSLIVMRKWLGPARFSRARLREMLRFALPLVPAGLGLWVVASSSRLVVGRYSDTAELGLLQLGFAVAAVAGLITGAFQRAWSPFALSIHKETNAREVYAAAFLVYVWGGCAVAAGLGMASRDAIAIFATRQYDGAASVVGLLAFSHVVVGLGYFGNVGLGIVKNTKPHALAIAAAAIVNVAMSFALIPSFGRHGAALAVLGSQAIIPLILFWRSQQVYRIPFRFGAAGALFGFAGVLMLGGGAVNVGSPWTNLIVKGALMTLFVPAAWLMDVFSPFRQVGAVVAPRRNRSAAD